MSEQAMQPEPTQPKPTIPTWSEFKAVVPTRLMLPLSEFNYTLQYVPVQLEPEQRRHALNIVVDAVVATLNQEPECNLTSLTVVPYEQGSTADETYFSLTFTNPVFDFAITMGLSSFTMIKRAATLQDLLLTCRIFVAITQRLFTLRQIGQDNVGLPFALGGINLQPVRVSFAWIHHLVLGTRLGTEIEATNSELLTKMLRLGSSGGSSVRPFSALSPGQIRRGDVNLGFTQEIEGRPRQLWINYEGPWNVTGKDINLATTYRLGESDCPMEPEDLYDFRTPFIAFFRDEVLNGFCSDLLESVNVQSRLA